jgi:hypothetical protein
MATKHSAKPNDVKTSEPQRRRFIAAARAAGCSEDEAVFDENLKKIARHKAVAKPPPKSNNASNAKGPNR